MSESNVEKVKQKLNNMTEQEMIDTNYCPYCFNKKGKISRLHFVEGCKKCFNCFFSIFGYHPGHI